DISLQKIGQKVDTEKVLDILKANGGSLNFTYKSDAENIKDVFAMSKKAFKATLTKLIDDKKLRLEEDKICLI
ncbi:DNA-binding protein, partial [Halarcobacter bivalviorum]